MASATRPCVIRYSDDLEQKRSQGTTLVRRCGGPWGARDVIRITKCTPSLSDHQVHPFMIMSMNSATIMSGFCSVTSDSMMTLPNSRLVPMNFTTMTPMSAKDIRGIVRTHPS